MNIPSLETILTDLDEARRQRNASNRRIEELTDALDNAGMIIERLTAERDNLLDAQSRSLQTIVKLTAERDRFADMISESSNRWQDMMFALREAKEALKAKSYLGDMQALATINKVLGDE